MNDLVVEECDKKRENGGIKIGNGRITEANSGGSIVGR
jgi:hypothetical protein